MVYYEDPKGRKPVEEYLAQLDGREREAVLFDIYRLGQYGMELGFPYTSHVRGKIRELRCRAKNQHRVFYFAAVGRQMALLHAFTKKTAKAPDHELQIAERRMSDFTQRLGQEPEKSR